MVLAYQTNRNELVGVVEFVGFADNEAHFKTVEEVGVRVRPLKKLYPELASIPAFAPGDRKTLYDITEAHAQLLSAMLAWLDQLQ